jgi:hypothetical protein
MVLPFVDQGPLFQRIDFTRGTSVGTNADLIRSSIPLYRCAADPSPLSIRVIAPDSKIYTAATGNYVGVKGMLSEMSSVRFEQVLDGLSNTLMLGERVYQPSVGGSDEFTSSWCGQLASDDSYIFNSIPQLAVHPLYAINDSLMFPHCFSSHHTGGANFTLGDGGVRFFSQLMDHDVLLALATPHGGEVVDF